jgi:hypothetical protein
MKDETYNAKEAMGKLKLPTTTFYRKVKEGEIPYKGQRPHMRFPKEAIDAIAELESEETSNELVFKPSSIADLWNKQEIIEHTYGKENVVEYKTVLSWRKRNEEISMQVNEGKKLLGWTMLLPLEEEIILQLLQEKLREQDIPPQAIRKWEDSQISVFISTLEVIETLNVKRDREVAALLIRRTIKWALSLMEQYDIKNWYAIGRSPEGQAILEALGFKQISNSDRGRRKCYKLEDTSKPTKLLRAFLRSVE